MPEQQDLRDRIVRLETNVEHLKENDIKLEKKIIELEDKIMTKLDELGKETGANFKKIEEYLNKQKGSWKAITVAASAVVGILATITYLVKLFSVG